MMLTRSCQLTPARGGWKVGLALFRLVILGLTQLYPSSVGALALASYDARRRRILAVAGLRQTFRNQFDVTTVFLLHERHIRYPLRPLQIRLSIIPLYKDCVISRYHIERHLLALANRRHTASHLV